MVLIRPVYLPESDPPMRETNNLTPSSDVVQPVRVWDLPTRLFHALLMVSMVGLVVTGEVGGAAMQLHFYFGYGVLSLLLFRVVWGVIGGRWSRFTSFLPTPRRVLRYLHDLRAGRHTPSVGHNPMGALSVFAMLGLLLVQVFTGFISDDEIAASGPWTPLVSGDWIERATEYHSEIGKTLIIALVVLHVASILFYKRFKHEDLVTPMVQGDKALPADTPASRDTAFTRVLALAVWAACAYAVYLAVNVSA
jgi:cytochrome b